MGSNPGHGKVVLWAFIFFFHAHYFSLPDGDSSTIMQLVPDENKREESWKNPSSAICEVKHRNKCDVWDKKVYNIDHCQLIFHRCIEFQRQLRLEHDFQHLHQRQKESNFRV